MTQSPVNAAGGVDGLGARYCLISWKGKDGSVHSAGPIGRERAEMIVEVYRLLFPDETYWLQPIPGEPEDAILSSLSY